jgi:aspartate/methionine/tyrosine aminotransferase
MPTPSRRAAGLEPSATVALADLAGQLRRAGRDVVDLAGGRAAEDPPSHVARAAAAAIEAGATHQTPTRGTAEFRAACARALERDDGMRADPEREVLATMGCKQGLLVTLLATLDPGDEVIVEDPGFVSYAPTIRMAGAVPVPVRLRPEAHFRWGAAELAAAAGPRTRAILLCSPHNPTGVVHTEEDLDRVAEVARGRDLLVISDAIYERLTWDGRRFVPIATRPGMPERTVTLFGLAKAFAMGGWRIGWLVAPPAIAEAVHTLQQHLITCAGAIPQAGATAALEAGATPEVRALWAGWEARCAYAADALDRVPGVSCAKPEGAFYAWVDVRDLGVPSARLAERILRGHGVAVVPGSAFGPGGEGWLRVTCARSREDVREGVARLAEALAAEGRR